MDEATAKTKWCPFAVVNNGQGHNANRDWEGRADSAFNRRSLCMGSACMAWRWDGERRQTHGAPYIEAIKAHREEHHCDLSTAKRAVDATWVTPSPTDGFCGLAGAVQ